MFRFLIHVAPLLFPSSSFFFESHVPVSPPAVQGTHPAQDFGPLGTAQGAMRRLLAEASVDGGLPPSAAVISRTIHVLDSLSVELPSHNWIVGHRVGLRVMLGQGEAALGVARECGADMWWCSLLEAYVLHVMQDFGAAETVLDAIAAQDRCRWTSDLSLYATPEMARAIGWANCATRIEREEHMWWLADPLYLLPYNDLRTEYFARSVEMRLHHEVLELDGGTCTPHHHASGMNMGWQFWTRGYMNGAVGSAEFTFLPSNNAVIRPLESLSSDWDLRSASSTTLSYTPPYGPIYELDSQLGSFLRGDSMHVVAGTEVEEHALSSSRTLQGGLILTESMDDETRIAWSERVGNRFVFRSTAPADPHLVGIELLSSDGGAARTRFGDIPPTHLPGRVSLSDILFFDWNDNVREDLDEIAPLIFGTLKFRRSRATGVFWEIYGLGEGEEINVSVVVEAQVGALRRIASIFGLGARRTPVQLGWREALDDADRDVVARALHLGIGALPAGKYSVLITVDRGDGVVARASRDFELLDG